MTQYALDTSILLRWFSQYHDADTDRALRLRQEQQEERVRITILDTTLCELAHILKEANRFSQGDIDAALASLGAYAYTSCSLPSAPRPKSSSNRV